MLENFKFHHIGYVTNNIMATSAFYLKLGYQKSPSIEDKIQMVYICFLKKEGFPTIELIEPANDQSSVNKILKRSGVAPYHVCYEVEDIYTAFEELVDHQGFTPLFRPVEAIALENRLICYLYRKEIGFIELLNKN